MVIITNSACKQPQKNESKMKIEDIKYLFENFELAASDLDGVECWSARELQSLLGYTQWRNFQNTI